MKNVIKGWVTTLLGLAIMVATCLYFFGLIGLPHPDDMPKDIQIVVAFGVGLALFLVPSTFLEDRIKGFIDKKSKE